MARHVGELNDLFAAELAARSSAEWLRLFDAAGIPAMAMHTPDSLLHDPHLDACTRCSACCSCSRSTSY